MRNTATLARMLATTGVIAMASIASPALAKAQPTPAPTPAPAPAAEVTAAPAPAAANPAISVNSADAPDQSGIADIVVTAQRRRERIQNVPIAISAFSSDQLAAQGISSTLALANYVPNLFAMNNTGLGSANAYYLRGLGNTETIATFDPPVGTYVDDIYISRQNANNLSLFDVERVEVLRGPQGTLFGRNTTGGAINVIMRQPGDRFGGYAELGYGSFRSKLARASVDVPLSPQFALKVSGYYQNDRGYARNVTTGERLNDDDGWGVRLGARAEFSPTIRWNGAATHIVADGENLLNFTCNPIGSLGCGGGRYTATSLRKGNRVGAFTGVTITGRKANFGLGNHTISNLFSSNFEIGLGQATTLNLITGYIDTQQEYALDFFDGRSSPSLINPYPQPRGLPNGGFTVTNDGRHRQFTQEAKISGTAGIIDYVAGVYYYKERNTTDFADVFGISPVTTLVLADRTLRNTTRAWAGYAQVDVNVTSQLKLTAGARYTDEVKIFQINDNRATCQVSPIPANCLANQNMIAPSGVRIPTRQQAKLWTPRFAINYRVDPTILLYASATRGFKSGGWNARGTSSAQLLPFGPEKVWSYEAGIKSDLFNRHVRANISVYQANVKDLQTPSALVAPSGAITFITRNFADYRNRGIEGEFIVKPVDWFNLYANVGYQKDKYLIRSGQPATDIYGIQTVPAQQAACRAALALGNVPTASGVTAACGAGIVNPRGNISTPVRTPDLTVSFGGSATLQAGRGMTLVPSLNFRHQSSAEVGTANYTIYSGAVSGPNGAFAYNPFGGTFITGSFSKPNWLVNAGVALNGPDHSWQLAVDCVNCTNEVIVQSALGNYSYLNKPMTWMGRLRVNF